MWHLDPKIATRHHHRVRSFDDLLDVADRLLVFHLRDHPSSAAQPLQQRAQLVDRLPFAHETQSHEIEPELGSQFDVHAVLVCERRHLHPDTRQVDVAA